MADETAVQNSFPAAEVTEDVVIIDGKPRPLKNFIAEISRKVKEEVTEELKRSSSSSEQRTTSRQQRLEEANRSRRRERNGRNGKHCSRQYHS